MSRSYRILAVALVGMLVLVGLARIVDGGSSSKGGTSSTAGPDTELAANTGSEAPNDTAGSTDSVTDVVDGDTATPTTTPPITAACTITEVLQVGASGDEVQCLESQLVAADLFCEATTDDSLAREAAEELTAALMRLPIDQREIVELETTGGLTLAEIAEITGLPPGTVATRYRTAIARLREWLTRKCND